MSKSAEQTLERSAELYSSKVIAGWEGLYNEKLQRLLEVFRPYFTGPSALEMGVADGEMTMRIAEVFPRLTCVDGSQLHLEQTHQRLDAAGYAEVVFAHSLFEDYTVGERFDAIFMTHVLEHIDDPVALLLRAAAWLAPGGRVFIAVPNCNSLHRHVGVKLGLIRRLDELNEQDHIVGHRRVYSPDLLRRHVAEANLDIVKFGGLMVKPLSNRQMESWPKELLNAFFAISDDFAEICSEIYLVAEQRADCAGR